MRVVILGSGVVGVTSARYLSQAGHEVTVIDRESGPALETSAANAGKSPGLRCAVGGPGVPLKAIKWMFQRHAPLAISLDGTQFQLSGCGRCCATATPATIWKTKGAWCVWRNTAATA